MRAELVNLVAGLRAIHGVSDLSMTTNGQRLMELAGPLRESGLDRVTVSMDSLEPEKFRRITRTGDLAAVMRGLDRAEDVGFEAAEDQLCHHAGRERRRGGGFCTDDLGAGGDGAVY